MSRIEELKELARILEVDLAKDSAVQQAYDEEHADFIGTGLKQVHHE